MSELLLVIIFGVMQGSIYAAVALGLVLVFGVTDIVNFAHGELVTFGAFGVILLTPVMGFVPALVLTLAGVALAAFGMYHLGFKLTVGNHLQALVFSLGLLLIIQSFMLRRFSTGPRDGPSLAGTLDIPGVGPLAWSRVAVLATLVLVVIAFTLTLRKSWIGLALRACADDHFAAGTLGMSARRVGMYAFTASGLLAAGAGVAIAAIYPVTPLTGAEFLLKGFVVVVIGGLGSATGALVASLAFGVLEALGATYIDPSMTDVYAFAIMIIVLLIAPQGLFNRKVGRAG